MIYFYIPACLAITLCLQANSKNELEKAIRTFDVKTVERIVQNEAFTEREYNNYASLAQEMVRTRELWTLLPNYYDDVSTPADRPSEQMLWVEGLALVGGLCMGRLTAEYCSESGNSKPLFITIGFCTVLIGKCLYDSYKCITAEQKQKECIRKKYEDAITIRQLIYSAKVVGN